MLLAVDDLLSGFRNLDAIFLEGGCFSFILHNRFEG